MSVRAFAEPLNARVSHLRTRNGDHEVDLIVERDDHRVLAVEVKLSSAITPRDTRHLDWLAGQIGDRLLDRVIIHTGTLRTASPMARRWCRSGSLTRSRWGDRDLPRQCATSRDAAARGRQSRPRMCTYCYIT